MIARPLLHLLTPKVTLLELSASPTRRRLSAKSLKMSNSPPARISVTFLSSGSRLSLRKCLCIETSHKSYLINTPESVSRVLQSCSVSASKISDIFVTSNDWQLCAGLLGMCLDISSYGIQSSVKLHGPPIVKDVANLMSKFSDTNTMRLDYHDSHEFADSAFAISSLCVDCSEDSTQSYCYLFEPVPTPPKINVAEALKLEFPVSMFKDGVTVNRIKAGETVEVPDGRRFAAEQLLIRQSPTRSFLVLDCASETAATQMLSSGRLSEWAKNERLGLTVHLADASLLATESYAQLIGLFSSSVKHVVMDDKSCLPSLITSHQMQLMLHSLHSGIFPLMYGHQFMSESDSPSAPVDVSGQLVSSREFLTLQLRPDEGFGGCDRDKFSAETFKEKTFEDNEVHIGREDFQLAMTRHRDRLSEAGLACPADGEYPAVQFLGTSSSHSTKHRNVSGVLLHLSSESSILLDCGEGTLFQLLNFYGPDECDRILRSVKAICLSHMHLDHQSGALCLLKARRSAFESVGERPTPCAFVGPRGFNRWLEFFSANSSLLKFDCAKELSLFYIESLMPPSSDESAVDKALETAFNKLVVETLGLRQLTPVPVKHSTKVAFGFVVRGPDWKIVYSGDTVTPCDSLISAGADCDLLIHEATFQPGLESLAAGKWHSTASQAAKTAELMRARHCVLTHFSARYAAYVPDNAAAAEAKEAEGESTTEQDASNAGLERVGFAYDHMLLRLSHLPALPMLAGMYKIVFPKHYWALRRRTQRFLGSKRRRDKGEAGAKRRRQ